MKEPTNLGGGYPCRSDVGWRAFHLLVSRAPFVETWRTKRRPCRRMGPGEPGAGAVPDRLADET